MYKFLEARWMKHFDFLILDTLMLQAAFIVSYFLRFGLEWPYASDFHQKIALLIGIINFCVVFFDEGHRGILKRGYLEEAKAVVKHLALVFGFLFLYLYLTKQSSELSRGLFSYFMMSSPIILWISRCVYKNFLIRNISEKTEKQYNMLVLTNKENVKAAVEGLEGGRYFVSGICLSDENKTGDRIGGVPVVCGMENLLDYIKKNVVDGLFVDLPGEVPLPDKILDTCTNMGVSTHIGLVRSDYGNRKHMVEKMGRYTVLTHSVQFASTRQLFIKRTIDICAGLAGLVVTAICFVFVAPAIYIASPGPIFFSQTRVGRNGRKFKIYKFRSMYMDAEERKKELMAQNKIKDGMMFKMDDDPRIIKGVGRFIRDYSIDELPQLWNVLKGEMSLVGTRPPTVEEYEKYDYHHKIRLSIKPGITGMWQVNGRSNITDFEQVVALDAGYITDWSLGLDLKILLKTVKVVLKKEGAV